MDAVQGFEACCVHASPSSSYRMPGCSLENRLKGRCCDQSPCRSGTLNVEISGDGQKIVFTSDVNYDSTGYLRDSDIEIWVHHVATGTTHRITHTRSHSDDDYYPHFNYDGTKVIWSATGDYTPAPTGSGRSSRDSWLTTLWYGCDDPRALNYLPNASVTECCRYADASLSGSEPFRTVRLVLAPKLADGSLASMTTNVQGAAQPSAPAVTHQSLSTHRHAPPPRQQHTRHQ